MGIFYILVFVYITTPIVFELLSILIYFSWGHGMIVCLPIPQVPSPKNKILPK